MRVSVLRALAATSAKTRVSRRNASYSARVNGADESAPGPVGHTTTNSSPGFCAASTQECVKEREDRSNQPKAERYRRDDGESGEGSAAERAECVEDVARQVIDQGRAAGVATPVGDKRHRAEARQRPSAGVRGAQSIRDVSLRVVFDMERELFVELVFDAAGRHQCTNA
jgi:hypothetical protein